MRLLYNMGVPGNPQNVRAEATGGTTATISWDPPTDNGGTAITGYTVTELNFSNLTQDLSANDISANITGLSNTILYHFTVKAKNSVGTSSGSEVSVIPWTKPGAPTGLKVATIDANNQITLAWIAPESYGGAPSVSYKLYYQKSTDSGPNAFQVEGNSITLGNNEHPIDKTLRTSYTFTVYAINSVGESTSGSNQVTFVIGTPSDPIDVTATKVNSTTALVSWNAPINTPTANYIVTTKPGNRITTVAGTSTSISGLTPGTSYIFQVQATNDYGSSPISSQSNQLTTATVPGAPTNVQAAATDSTTAFVSWNAPTSNGGEAISSYTVTTNPGNRTTTVVGTSTSISGLTPGTSYTFTVKATNVAGPSPNSDPRVTVAGAPRAPTGVTAVAASGVTAKVSWTTPANNGSKITKYTVKSSPGNVTATATGTSKTATIKGLQKGTAYTFTVTALNAKGTSNESIPSPSTTTWNSPGAPTGVTAVAKSSTSALVSWTAPAANGSKITKYTVKSSPGNKTATSTSTSKTMTGLKKGTSYTFGVTATNVVGTSSTRVSNTVTTPNTKEIIYRVHPKLWRLRY